MSEPRANANVRKLTLEERWLGVRGRVFQGLRFVVAGALVVGSAFGARVLYQYIMSAPELHISHFNVVGAERANIEEIELLGSSAYGKHIFDIDTRAVARQIVVHPWVAWVEVRRALPDGLTIDILEREPVALLMAGDLYYVDGAGVPFKKLSAGEDMDLPLLTGFEDEKSPLRTDRALGRQAVMAGLALLGALEAAGHPRDRVSEIHLDPERGYSVFFTDGGAEVVLGWDAFAVKLKRLNKLEHNHGLELTRIARVDLDLDRAAVVTTLDEALLKTR